jgi:hypothetical protein
MHLNELAGKLLRLRGDLARARNDRGTPPRYLQRLQADLERAEVALLKAAPETGRFLDTLPLPRGPDDWA